MHAHSCSYEYGHTYRQTEKEAWTCTTGISSLFAPAEVSGICTRFQTINSIHSQYLISLPQIFHTFSDSIYTGKSICPTWDSDFVSCMNKWTQPAWIRTKQMIHGKLLRRLNFKTWKPPLGYKLLWMTCLFKEITINGKSILYRDSTYGFETIFLLTQNICCMSISLTGFRDIVYTPKGYVVCVSVLTS